MITVSNVSVQFGKRVLFNDVNLKFTSGNCYGIIGANGAGKSTFLRTIYGDLDPTTGTIALGPGERLSVLSQDHFKWDAFTVMDTVMMGHTVLWDIMKQREILYAKEDFTDEDGLKVSELEEKFAELDGWNAESDAAMLLSGLGVKEDKHYTLMGELSGKEKVRVMLAQALYGNPDNLLLDEPTNDLDMETVMWLEDYLKDYKGALLMVSHDRYFLDRLCTSICEIERGTLTRYKGNYTTFTQLKEAAVARQWKEYEMQQKEIAKLEDYVARNLTRASTAKSAQSRVKQLEKMERIEKPVSAQKQARVQFTYEIEPPQEVLKVQNIDISVGEGAARKTLLPELSFEVRRGEKWGIIGDNGIGKSTLLKILQNKLPHQGKVRWTSNIKISYFEQESTNLHPAKSVMQEIHDRVPSWTDLEVRKLLGQVRLTGENVFKPVGVLSGGERAKVCFAVMMLEHGNVLILDEPTNHLDIAMKEVIEEAMQSFTGTLLFVSHDRYLLDKVADHILELKADGAVTYQGGFQKWLEAQQKQPEPEETPAAKTAASGGKPAEKPAYRSKKQRAQQAKMRADLRSLEQQLDKMQEELDTLTAELTDEAVCSDFQLMQEKCQRMEELRVQMDETMEQMILLEEELG